MKELDKDLIFKNANEIIEFYCGTEYSEELKQLTTDLRLEDLMVGTEEDVLDFVYESANTLNFNIKYYEDLEMYEVCAKLKKVLEIQIKELIDFLVRKDLYVESYDESIFEALETSKNNYNLG